MLSSELEIITKTEVQLPAAMKANMLEAGADVKASDLSADAGHLEDGGLMSQSPSPGRWGSNFTKPISPLIGGRGVFLFLFYKGGEWNRTKRSREGVAKFSTCR